MVDYILPPDFVYGKIIDGNGFVVPSLMDVPADGSVNVHIRNPSNDRTMWLAAMRLSVTGSAEFYLHDDFESVTDGDPIDIQNALVDEENGGVDGGPFEAYENSTYTPITSYPIGFTEDTGPSRSHGIEAVSTTMEPNRQTVIEIRNQDNGQNKAYFGALVLTSY